jgi:hypothetical protein
MITLVINKEIPSKDNVTEQYSITLQKILITIINIRRVAYDWYSIACEKPQ